jgi:hypothetical protein
MPNVMPGRAQRPCPPTAPCATLVIVAVPPVRGRAQGGESMTAEVGDLTGACRAGGCRGDHRQPLGSTVTTSVVITELQAECVRFTVTFSVPPGPPGWSRLNVPCDRDFRHQRGRSGAARRPGCITGPTG